jgi:hypothetical protein
MSNHLSIQTALPIHGTGARVRPNASAPPQAAAATATQPAQVFVNPAFRFDPSVGMVVIEFHDDSGKMTNSIPSERQLQAYRTHQETPGEQAAPPPQPVDAKTSSG